MYTRFLYTLFFSCHIAFLSASPLMDVASYADMYNQAPDLGKQKPLYESKRILCSYIKRHENNFSEFLNRLYINNIGIFAIHRHSRLQDGDIVLEDLKEDNDGNKSLVTTTTTCWKQPPANIKSIFPSCWVISNINKVRQLYPFEYTKDCSSTHLSKEQIEDIERLGGYINSAGLANSVGIKLINKVSLPRKEGQKYVEQNLPDASTQNKAFSIVTVAGSFDNIDKREKLDTEQPEKIPTAMFLNSATADCECGYDCYIWFCPETDCTDI